MNYTICYLHPTKGLIFGKKAISLEDAIFLCAFMQGYSGSVEHCIVTID